MPQAQVEVRLRAAERLAHALHGVAVTVGRAADELFQRPRHALGKLRLNAGSDRARRAHRAAPLRKAVAHNRFPAGNARFGREQAAALPLLRLNIRPKVEKFRVLRELIVRNGKIHDARINARLDFRLTRPIFRRERQPQRGQMPVGHAQKFFLPHARHASFRIGQAVVPAQQAAAQIEGLRIVREQKCLAVCTVQEKLQGGKVRLIDKVGDPRLDVFIKAGDKGRTPRRMLAAPIGAVAARAHIAVAQRENALGKRAVFRVGALNAPCADMQPVHEPSSFLRPAKAASMA